MKQQNLKRVSSIVLALLLTLSVFCLPISAASGYEWAGFGKNYDNMHYTDAKTPQKAVEKWIYTLKDPTDWATGVSDIVIAENRIFTAAGNKLIKISKSGKAIADKTLDASIDYTCRLCYANGKVLVPLSGGRLQAINASTMKSEWVTAPVVDEADSTRIHQSLTTVTVSGNYAYYGTAYADWTTSYSGVIRKVDLKTGNIKWEYKNNKAGYYWSGVAVYGNYAVVAGDDGKVIALNISNGKKVSSLNLKAGVRSTIIKKGERLYVAATNGTLYKLSLSDDGVLKRVKSVKFAESSTCTPTITEDGKIYIGGSLGADSGYKGVIAVIKNSDMSVISTSTTVADVKSSPLVTSAYGTSYAYFTSNSTPGSLYMLKGDKTVSELYTPAAENQNYCMANIVSDNSGVLYYTNDSGKLFAVKPLIVKISLSKSAITMGVGEKVSRIKAAVSPASMSSKVKWTTSNQKIATVDKNGVITAKKVGTATVTATVDGKKATCKITVKPAPKSVRLDKTVLTLKLGKTYDLTSIVNRGAGACDRIYKSSNKSVATVTNYNGVVTAKKVGTATITVICYNGVKATCKVKVVK